MPGLLIGRYLLGTLHDVIGGPGRRGRHHVVVIAEGEPPLLLVSDQAGEVHAVVVAGGLYLLLLPLALVPVEIVGPAAGHTLQRGRMVAEGGMHGGIIGDTGVECGGGKGQEASLTAARHTQLLIVPRGVFCDIVEGTDTADHDTLVVTLVAIVESPLPVAHQGSVEHIVVDLLLHRDRHAVDADLQRDGTLRGCPDVAAIGAHAGSRHTEQGRILAFLHWNTKNAVCAIVLLDILEADLVDVHVLRAALRQQALGGIEVHLAGLLDGVLPVALEVLRHDRRGLQLLG